MLIIEFRKASIANAIIAKLPIIKQLFPNSEISGQPLYKPNIIICVQIDMVNPTPKDFIISPTFRIPNFGLMNR